MTRIALFAGLLFAGCVLMGCPVEPGEPEPPGPDDDDDGDDDDSQPPLGSATVIGSVVDTDGAAVEGLSVSLCGVSCYLAITDAEGLFTFTGIPAGTKVIEPTLAHTEEGEEFSDAVRRWTRFFDFTTVEDGQWLEFDEPFVLYPVDNTVGPLTGPVEMQVLPELGVSFDADVIVDDGALPAGADGVYLGGTAIAPEHWPVRGLDGWTIHGAWGLAIWDLEAPDVFQVAVDLPIAIDPSMDVAFLVADYTYGFTEGRFWHEPAELSPDGLTLTTPTDGGLDRATLWLAVSRQP